MTEAPQPAIFLDDDVEGEDPEVSATLADRKDGPPPTIEVDEAEVEEEEEEGEGLLMADEGGGEEGEEEEMEEGVVPDTPTWDDEWDKLDLHPKVRTKLKSVKTTVYVRHWSPSYLQVFILYDHVCLATLGTYAESLVL